MQPMKQNGRRSAASLGPAVPVFEPPLEPPEQLPEDAKEVWRGIVSGFRDGWSQGAEDVLKAYCQTCAIERQIAGMLSHCETGGPQRRQLIRLYFGVVASLISTATKLRLTPQSSRNSRHTKHVPRGPQPWEDLIEPEPSKPSQIR